MRRSSHSDLAASHTPELIRERLAAGYKAETYVSDFIFGAIDGTVTTFAVVAGVAGAGLNDGVIILLGVANLAADGFSMAASSFLGNRAEAQGREKTRLQEEEHIAQYPDGEREEIRQIFYEKGFRDRDLERIVEVISDNDQRWVDTMLREEHGYADYRPMAWKAAGATFIAFLIVGSVPLMSYLINWASPGLIGEPFQWSCVLTAVAFFVVGALKSCFAIQHWLVSALETLALGSIAATIAYVIGEALKSVA